MKRPEQPSTRPYRLYITLLGVHYRKAIPWRCYAHPWTAHTGALVYCKQHAKPGEVIQIWNINRGRLVFEYIRQKTDIQWRGPRYGRKGQGKHQQGDEEILSAEAAREARIIGIDSAKRRASQQANDERA